MNTASNPIKYYGADYYPEHWPEERWATDAKLMQEAGFNTVRLAEFAWVKMEPKKGEFDFRWLQKMTAILQEHGISVVLGTPTAAAPAWLMETHPEIFRVNERQQRTTFGNLQFMCINSSTFRKASRRITKAMSEAMGTNGCRDWLADRQRILAIMLLRDMQSRIPGEV